MKYILPMILVIASLISAASAVGNSISQSNDVSASGSGAATISSSEDNTGLVIGNYNSLTQTNGADLYNTAVESALSLTQDSDAVIVGDWNNVFQDNLAWADNYYGYGNIITQTQDNLVLIMGDGNRADQSNDAWDVIYGGRGNTITDDQSNEVVQISNSNTIDQKNDKRNRRCIESKVIDINGNQAKYTVCEDEPGAVIIDGIGNKITQKQSNSGFQGGSGNNFMKQYNDAKAEINNSQFSSITQKQSNTGFQYGDYNTLFQTNLLKNYANTSGQGFDVFFVPLMINLYWTSTSVPVPGALIFAGDGSTINQEQSNLGLQIGDFNDMQQYNDAKAEIILDWGSTINQYQSNTGFQYGNYNTLYQINMKKNWNVAPGSSSWSNPNGFGQYSWIETYPIAGDLIFAGQYDNLYNDQFNFGTQIGNSNYMSQYNDAYAEDDEGWYTDIVQTQSNIAMQVGDWNDLYQDNYAYAFNHGDNNLVLQTESNLLLMIGSSDYSGQTNYQYASQGYDSSTTIDEDSSNDNVILS